MKKIIGLLVVGVLGAGYLAMAQQDVAKPWGASVTAGAQYTDNRDGADQNKENNVDFFIEPRGDVYWRDGERTVLDFFLAPMAKFHSNPREEADGNPQNDAEMFGSVGIDLMHQVAPRLGIKVGDTLIYNDDPAIDAGGVNVRESASHVLNTAYGEVTGELTPKVGAGVGVNSVIKRYSEESVANEQDESILGTEAKVGYLMGSGYKVFGVAGYSVFDNESIDRERGSQVSAAGVGIEKIFNPDVRGTVIGGYQSASYADDTLDDVDTANGKLELVFRAQSATRFRVGATYGFFAPYVEPYSLQTLASVQGSVEHDVLPERLTVALRGQYSNGEYESEGEKLPGGSDNLALGGLSATYRINRNWSLGAGYTYENWDSDIRESFSRNIVDASVKAQF